MSQAQMLSMPPGTGFADPYYGASLGVAWSRFWKKYVVFSGRASRSEYWWMQLVVFLLSALINALSLPVFLQAAIAQQRGLPSTGSVAMQGLLTLIVLGVSLALFLPLLGLLVRRLHDTNRSAHYLWMYLIPIAGPILLLVFTILDSNPLGERFDEFPAAGVDDYSQATGLPS